MRRKPGQYHDTGPHAADQPGGMTMKPIHIVLPGDPVPWARAGSDGKRRYTPAPQAAHAKAIGYAARAVMGPMQPLEGPVRLWLDFVSQWPSKKHRALAQFVGWKATRPDLDNLSKQVLDALQGIAFADDAAVADLRARKRYGDEAKTVILIEPIVEGVE